MQSVWVSLVALLAAASIAAPVDTLARRGVPGVGSVTAPLTTVLSEVGKQTPSTVNKVTDAAGGAKDKAVPQAAPQAMNNSTMNSTAPAKPKSKASDPVSGIVQGLLGGL